MKRGKGWRSPEHSIVFFGRRREELREEVSRAREEAIKTQGIAPTARLQGVNRIRQAVAQRQALKRKREGKKHGY